MDSKKIFVLLIIFLFTRTIQSAGSWKNIKKKLHIGSSSRSQYEMLENVSALKDPDETQKDVPIPAGYSLEKLWDMFRLMAVRDKTVAVVSKDLFTAITQLPVNDTVTEVDFQMFVTIVDVRFKAGPALYERWLKNDAIQ